MEVTVRVDSLEGVYPLSVLRKAIEERFDVAAWHTNISINEYDALFNYTPMDYNWTRARYVNKVAGAVEYLLDYYVDCKSPSAMYLSTSYSNFPKTLKERYLQDREHQIEPFVTSQGETFSDDSMEKYQHLLSCCAYWLNQMTDIQTRRYGCTQYWPRNGNTKTFPDGDDDNTQMLCVVNGDYYTPLRLYYSVSRDWYQYPEYHGQPPSDIFKHSERFLSGYTGMYVDNRCGFNARCKLYLCRPYTGDWIGRVLGEYVPLTAYYFLQANKWENLHFQCQMGYDIYWPDGPDAYGYPGLVDTENADYALFGTGDASFSKLLQTYGSGIEYNEDGPNTAYAHTGNYWDFKYNCSLDGHQTYTVSEEESLSSWEGRDGPRAIGPYVSRIISTANKWYGFGYWGRGAFEPISEPVPANVKKLVTPRWNHLPAEPMNPNFGEYDNLSKYERRTGGYWEENYKYIYDVHVVPIMDFTNSFTTVRITVPS